MPHFTGRSEITATALHAYGCYTPGALAAVARDPDTRLHQVLLRFHQGRMVCAAQDADPIIRALESALPPWTLRDVSQPSNDPIAAEARAMQDRQRNSACPCPLCGYACSVPITERPCPSCRRSLPIGASS